MFGSMVKEMLEAIISALFSYITSVWTCARLVFSALDVPLMTNCVQLLAVVCLIGIVDNLPNWFGRERKKKKQGDED